MKSCEHLSPGKFPAQPRADFQERRGLELWEGLRRVLDTNCLFPSSFLVEKQPPQVLKTQTKFQAGVRFLLGLRFLGTSAKLPMVRADMVTEKQARELNQLQSSGTGT